MPDSSRPVALITGASAGLGVVFARKLAARGYDLILTARRLDRLEKLGAEVSAACSVSCEALAADLGDPTELRTVEERIRRCERLALLVNNAGFGTTTSFAKSDVDAQELMIRVHIIATMRLTRAALAVMMPKRSGAIINVSSLAAFETNPGSVGYSASKAWINRFTEGLELELRGAGSPVKVQALCPGFTYTEFHDVIHMDRGRIPKSLWLPAEFVVDASLAGLDRGQLIVIPGWRYRVLKTITGLAPKFLKRQVAIATGRRMGRQTTPDQ
jgi:short-subunit dehydrogenase